jgi:hypothetical protein
MVLTAARGTKAKTSFEEQADSEPAVTIESVIRGLLLLLTMTLLSFMEVEEEEHEEEEEDDEEEV